MSVWRGTRGVISHVQRFAFGRGNFSLATIDPIDSFIHHHHRSITGQVCNSLSLASSGTQEELAWGLPQAACLVVTIWLLLVSPAAAVALASSLISCIVFLCAALLASQLACCALLVGLLFQVGGGCSHPAPRRQQEAPGHTDTSQCPAAATSCSSSASWQLVLLACLGLLECLAGSQ